jgi:hypothetical protein
MQKDKPLQIVSKIADVLDTMKIRYLLGGSFASSFYGIPRSTLDADLVADLGVMHIEPLISALSNDFYMDAGAMREAIQKHSSFNVIHLQTMFKVDIFILKEDEFSKNEMERRGKAKLGEDTDRDLFIASAEDTILQKLLWFQAGGGVSDRQWNDVMEILRVQSGKLDKEYLERNAESVGVNGLLEKAFREAE